MYRCTLHVGLLRLDERLRTALEQTPPMERFTHRFYPLDQPEPAACGELELLICQHLPTEEGAALRALCPPSTQLVLLADALTPEEADRAVAVFDELWTGPLTADTVTQRFRRLLERLKLEKDRELGQVYLDSLINSIPDLVWFKDIQGAHLKVNDAFCLAVGKTHEDIQGRGHYYIWDLKQEEYEKGEYVCLETEEAVLQAQKTCLFDEKVKSKNGLRQFKTYKSPLFFGADRTIIGTVGIAHDVTALENIGTELEILLRSLPFAILILGDDGQVINANDRFADVFELPKDQILGQSYSAWKQQTFPSQDLVNAEGYVEAAFLGAGGRRRILEIHEEPIFDIFGTEVGQLCLFRDVTVERTLEEQIRYNSNTDFLTGLSNRRYFYEYMAKHRGTYPVSLLYVDLDHFKEVNDTYGHQAGDEALVVTANLLRRCFPDAFITRLGGDEFVVALLGEITLADLEQQAKALLAEMRTVFQTCRQFSLLTASAGIAQAADSTIPIDTLLQQSDLALYSAKQQGRNRCCVYPHIPM